MYLILDYTPDIICIPANLFNGTEEKQEYIQLLCVNNTKINAIQIVMGNLYMVLGVYQPIMSDLINHPINLNLYEH